MGARICVTRERECVDVSKSSWMGRTNGCENFWMWTTHMRSRIEAESLVFNLRRVHKQVKNIIHFFHLSSLSINFIIHYKYTKTQCVQCSEGWRWKEIVEYTEKFVLLWFCEFLVKINNSCYILAYCTSGYLAYWFLEITYITYKFQCWTTSIFLIVSRWRRKASGNIT